MPIQFNSSGCGNGNGNIVSGNVGTDGYIPGKGTLLNILNAHNDPQHEYLSSLGLENWSLDSFNPSQNQACITYKNPTTGLEVPTIITLPNPDIPFTGGGVTLPDGSVYWPPTAFPTNNGECC